MARVNAKAVCAARKQRMSEAVLGLNAALKELDSIQRFVMSRDGSNQEKSDKSLAHKKSVCAMLLANSYEQIKTYQEKMNDRCDDVVSVASICEYDASENCVQIATKVGQLLAFFVALYKRCKKNGAELGFEMLAKRAAEIHGRIIALLKLLSEWRGEFDAYVSSAAFKERLLAPTSTMLVYQREVTGGTKEQKKQLMLARSPEYMESIKEEEDAVHEFVVNDADDNHAVGFDVDAATAITTNLDANLDLPSDEIDPDATIDDDDEDDDVTETMGMDSEGGIMFDTNIAKVNKELVDASKKTTVLRNGRRLRSNGLREEMPKIVKLLDAVCAGENDAARKLKRRRGNDEEDDFDTRENIDLTESEYSEDAKEADDQEEQSAGEK